MLTFDRFRMGGGMSTIISGILVLCIALGITVWSGRATSSDADVTRTAQATSLAETCANDWKGICRRFNDCRIEAAIDTLGFTSREIEGSRVFSLITDVDQILSLPSNVQDAAARVAAEQWCGSCFPGETVTPQRYKDAALDDVSLSPLVLASAERQQFIYSHRRLVADALRVLPGIENECALSAESD